MSQTQSTTSSLYDGAAELGKVQSTISLWFGTIVSILLIIIGLYMIFRKTSEYKYISAKVLSIDNCIRGNNRDSNSKTTNYDDCVLKLEFVVGDIKYNTSIQHRYNNNEMQIIDSESNKMIDIYYNVENPNDITLTNPKLIKIFGAILIVIGVIISGAVYFNNKLVNKNKAYAAYSGAQTATSGLVNIFKN